MNLVLADSSYSPRSARDQSSSAQNVLRIVNIDDVARFVRSVKAPAARDHISCFDLEFFHSKESLSRQTEMIENVELYPEGIKERLLHVFRLEYQAFVCWR